MDFEPNDIRTIVDGCLERWFKRILGLVLGSAVTWCHRVRRARFVSA